MSKQLTIGIIVIAVAIAGVLMYRQFSPKTPQACTLEAKICPDGSSVGRTGPHCEFALCPGEVWQTSTDRAQGVSFQYPQKLPAQYITAVDWPPQIQIIDEPFQCVPAGSESDRAGRTEIRGVGNRTYCRTVIAEGAAGSIYNLYAYSMQINGSVAILTFSTQSVQCGNYEPVQQAQCEAERADFKIDVIADRIMQTLQM